MDNLFDLMLVAASTGFVTAASVVGLLSMAPSGRRAAAELVPNPVGGGALVFEGPCLIYGEGPALAAFRRTPPSGSDWDRTSALLAPMFPDLADSAAPALVRPGRRAPVGSQPDLVVIQDSGETRLEFGGEAGDAPQTLDDATGSTAEHAAARAANGLPFPVWLDGPDGEPRWVNQAYLDAAAAIDGVAADIWPPPRIFDPGLVSEAGREQRVVRASLPSPGDVRPRWFDVHAAHWEDSTLFAAVGADAAVAAEARLREFTQTLSKTFADLTVGLAIFDRARRLVLFNPSLIDLTSLPADFLASRPTLLGFLDRLRECRVIPEPEDYRSWRRQMAELESAAVNGSYSETWSLPTGQTYRVTGRPHPDGAIIFVFEDITAEISLTRRFRAELEMGQAVIDSLGEAIAVFSAGGVLALSNQAYAELWGHDPGTGLSDLTISEATSSWMSLTTPTSVWSDFRAFVQKGHGRTEWSADVRMRDGRGLHCRFIPTRSGATLVTFRLRRLGDISLGPGVRESA